MGIYEVMWLSWGGNTLTAVAIANDRAEALQLCKDGPAGHECRMVEAACIGQAAAGYTKPRIVAADSL